MDIQRLAGNNWRRARLLFDDLAQVEKDALPILDAPTPEGVFSGRFQAEGGGPLPDELIDGRFTSNGSRPEIVFTRKHPEGTVTTYSGRVLEVAGETTLMIRGKFTRKTTNADGTVTLAGGDYEAEKPT